jgi:hypothetical protein
MLPGEGDHALPILPEVPGVLPPCGFSERSIQDLEIRLFQLRAFVKGTLLPEPGAEPELPERATIDGWLGSLSALLVSPEKRPKPACLPTGPP